MCPCPGNNELIGDIKGNLRMTLNKLPGIRENLTANWTNWGFPELVKALESWTRRNAKTVDIDLGTRRNEKPVSKSSTGCTKVTELNEQKKIFSSKKLCFNRSGSKHRASECKITKNDLILNSTPENRL